MYFNRDESDRYGCFISDSSVRANLDWPRFLDIEIPLPSIAEQQKAVNAWKAFFDVLVEVRDKHGFEYADDRCIELAKKIKLLIDDTAIYTDWLNNDNLKSKLASQLTYLLYKEGYPPQWDEEIFQKVLEQVENYKSNSSSQTRVRIWSDGFR